MITTVSSVRSAQRTAKHAANPRRVVLDRFDCFVLYDGEDNDRIRQRYRMLLLYGCEHCLTAEELQAVQGYYREGKSLAIISQENGVSVSTLSRRLKSARYKLLELTEHADAIRQICSMTE